MFHVALYQPSIPPNTGNIGRQCVGMNVHLHLIGPLAIDLSAQATKRAGLDYWKDLKLTVHDTPDAFLQWLGDRQPWLISKHGKLRYDRVPYRRDDVLLLGNEVTGLPDAWHQRWPERVAYVPILGPVRSYNLANTAAIVMAQCCLTAGLYDE
ncbi:MAG: tRNA (cytidine(34)-2'-O)-methyltransferase [Phycisphaeraceae bacterium]